MKYFIGILITAFILFVAYYAYLFTHLCGGAGKIKGYQFTVSKYVLEKAVNIVLNSNRNLQRDTIKQVITYLDSNSKIDHRYDDYWNDGIHNLTLKITKDTVIYDFVIGYFADSAYWDTSKNSEIAIVYADGYSEGENKPTEKLKRRLTNIFETEFIDKVDKQLGKVHTVVD